MIDSKKDDEITDELRDKFGQIPCQVREVGTNAPSHWQDARLVLVQQKPFPLRVVTLPGTCTTIAVSGLLTLGVDARIVSAW